MLWWAEVAPKQFVSTAFIPAFFTAGSNDNFIPPAHTQELFDMYAGDKNIVFVSSLRADWHVPVRQQAFEQFTTWSQEILVRQSFYDV